MESFDILRVGYSFVPPQRFEKVYPVEEALLRGTLFPELYLPFGVYDKANCGEKKGACDR